MSLIKVTVWVGVGSVAFMVAGALISVPSPLPPADQEGPPVYVDLGDGADAKGHDVSPTIYSAGLSKSSFRDGGVLLLAGPCGECTRARIESTPLTDSRGRPIVIVVETKEMFDVLGRKLGKHAALDERAGTRQTLGAKFTPRRYLFDPSLRVTAAETGNPKVDKNYGFDPQ